MTDADLAVRQPSTLRPDPTRVLARLFVPGRLEADDKVHVVDAVTHILGLDEDEVSAGLAEIVDRFAGRHRSLRSTFDHHAERVSDRIPADHVLSEDRRMLLGAAFTQEYSIEAAAVCNPSFVLAPSQGPSASGGADLVMSLRGIGEGHRSSIEFRMVSVDESGQVSVEATGPFAGTGSVSAGTLHADRFHGPATRPDGDESTRWVLDQLGDEFTRGELDRCLVALEKRGDTRVHVHQTAERLRALAARSYQVDFDPSCGLGERVLHPAAPIERNGMEDARFVRFVDEQEARYYATYTAYDGTNIAQQLLETTDFVNFESSPLQGPGAKNKGLALFPRRVGGRYAALSRHDGATNGVAFTDDLRHWPIPNPIQRRTAGRPALRNAVQVGNCGSPIETPVGWLVLTHGVGPMRTYSIGACLLDLDDPTQLVAELSRPLLSPQPDERDGYVPNVVYSCGAAHVGSNLVIPFGVADSSIRFASAPMELLLDAMVAI